MIAYIKGTVDSLTDSQLVLEHQGIGYEIGVPASLYDSGIRAGQELKVYTYLSVREDGVALYGFPTKDDRKVFGMLLGVSGIGPKAALGILSTLSADNLRFAVLSDDTKTICRAPGIGKKTAQKLILELKDKFDLREAFEQSFGGGETPAAPGQADSEAFQDAVEALGALGYSGTEALQAVRRVENAAQMSSEELLKAALKKMI